MMKSMGRSDWKTFVFPLLLFVFVLVFSLMALWIGDDITYMYNFKDGTKITSFGQVIQSQIEHWHTVNGRTPAHFLCQLFIPFWGQTAFSIVNACIYVLLLLFMAKLAEVRMSEFRIVGLITCLIILGFRTKFTPTCQIGFPWMFCLVAGYLLLLKDFSISSEKKMSSWHLLWAFPFAFIAGWSQEALVVGVGAALAVFVLRNIRKVTLQQWVLLVAFAAGAALLCLSPATIGRTGEKHGGSAFLSSSLMSVAKFGYYLRITYLLLIYVIFLLVSKKAKLKELVMDAGFYWIVWAVMLVFNLLIGVYGNRQLFGMEFAAMMILLGYVQKYSFSADGRSRLVGIALPVLAVLVLWVAVDNGRFLKHHGDVYDEILSSYSQSPDGTVYHDFSADDVTFIDTYPSDVFSWYAMKTMSRKLDPARPLNVVPTLCSGLRNGVSGNSWKRTADGTVAVIIDKKDPPEKVEISRSLFHHQISAQTVSLAEPVFENDDCMVVLVYEKLPLVKYDDVYFEK